MEKTCLDCGKSIYGRADKKFCDDACRNSYNNKEHRDLNNYMRKINRILSKNRKILSNLNRGEKTVVTKDKLLSKGFDFNYFTNTYTTKLGKVYFFCYDQGYLALENQRFSIVLKKEYVN